MKILSIKMGFSKREALVKQQQCWALPSNMGITPTKQRPNLTKNWIWIKSSWCRFFFANPIWLVVWNMAGLWLSIQLGMSSSQLTFTPSFFRGVGQPPIRSNQQCSMFSSGFHHTKMSTLCQVGDFQVSIHDSFSDRAVMTFLLRRLPERDEKGYV